MLRANFIIQANESSHTMRLLNIFLISFGMLLFACGQEGEQMDESAMEEVDTATETEEVAATDTLSAEDWQIRLDYPSRGSTEDITVNAIDNGVQIVAGPRAIYYRDGESAEGSYRYSARFTQNNQPGPEGYGLFVGGQNLQDEDQQYLYFLIRQSGEFLIKRRSGDDTETVVGWTAHETIQSVEDKDMPVNTLTVDAQSDSLHFMINDARVESLSRKQVGEVAGQAGLRVNHRLDVSVENINLESL